jgi:hypothetical protein
LEPNHPNRDLEDSGLRSRGLLTKDEAFHEAIRRWHQLPSEERQTYMHAQVLAAGLAEELDFRTMANRRKIIEAWLVRDLDQSRQAAE